MPSLEPTDKNEASWLKWLNDASLVVDAEFIIIKASPQIKSIFGWEADEIIGQPLSILIPSTLSTKHQKHTYNYIKSPICRYMDPAETIEGLCKDGSHVPLSIFLFPMKVSGQWQVRADIKDLRVDDAIENNELLFYKEVFSKLSEGFYIVSADDSRIIYTNNRFNEMFGYETGELIGLPASVLHSVVGRPRPETPENSFNDVDESFYWEGEVKNQRKDGTIFWCNTKNSVVEHPKLGKFWLSIHTDITKQKFQAQKIWRQSNFDELTSLPNREYFTERLSREASKTEHTNNCISLLFINLDDFKNVNDSLGHHFGDALLIEFSSRLENIIHECDIVGRFSGDVFLIMLNNIDAKKLHIIEEFTTKLQAAINAPFLVGGELLFVSASVGISVYPNDTDCITELYSYAEQAMYAAKKHGKNCVHFFTFEMNEIATRNHDLTVKLRTAIEQSQFEVHYQPIVETSTRKIYKAEALIRWNHPDYGNISPAEFIPLAESSKLINDIGELVLTECIDKLTILRQKYDANFQLSINKSPVQFQANPIATEVTWKQRMEQSGLPCGALNIEITESLLLEDDDKITAKFEKLRLQGFKFSIDDFGTGYSALAYLKRIEVDYLKIDQSFIRNLDINSKDQALCEAITVMAHKLGMKVIAEGVETEKQLNILEEMGCDYCQGYYFSKPCSFNDFLALLEPRT